jgi:hypothetical protein
LFINIALLTGNSENIIDFMDTQTFDWRVKGEVGSDVQRIRYFNIVYNYLTNEELLTGAGFGIRGYRANLSKGEDVHNAFLTTFSDSGYIGTYILIFICCLWPALRQILLKKIHHLQSSLLLISIFSTATFFPAPLYGNQYFSIAILYVFYFVKRIGKL